MEQPVPGQQSNSGKPERELPETVRKALEMLAAKHPEIVRLREEKKAILEGKLSVRGEGLPTRGIRKGNVLRSQPSVNKMRAKINISDVLRKPPVQPRTEVEPKYFDTIGQISLFPSEEGGQ